MPATVISGYEIMQKSPRLVGDPNDAITVGTQYCDVQRERERERERERIDRGRWISRWIDRDRLDGWKDR